MSRLSGPARGALLLTFAYLWCAYVMIFDPARRFSAPAYDSPKHLMPIKAWGALLLTLTICHAILIVRQSRLAMALVSAGFVTFLTCFGLALLASARSNANVGRLGFGFVAGLASIHLAIAIWPERQP